LNSNFSVMITRLKSIPRNILLLATFGLGTILLVSFFGFGSETVDYNTQVKPILNRKCITCHGGVKAKGGFSLMTREDALMPTKSGKPAIVPGKPRKSEMYTRLITHDVEQKMPYKKEPLSEKEISIIYNWIDQGATWGTHWAYKAVENVDIPKPKGSFFGLFAPEKIDWVKNDVDYFIYNRLKKEKLDPSVLADKNTILRRVSLDLIGMPASSALKNAFLNDDTPQSYERLVDSLLASKRYGERWTSLWLDIARYADTKGYERDDKRDIWRYRDWLIKAFNQNMPYDRFLTEQIAGDLLPNATDEQIIATAFHRNTLTNDEGGTENEEFRTAATLDRVNTTWEGLMGTTFACTQCHGHPYDPFKHEEYYQFLAFFNNSRDEDTYEDYPLLRHFGGQDSTDFLVLKNWLEKNATAVETKRVMDLVKMWQPVHYSLATDNYKNAALYDEKWLGLRQNASTRLKNVNLEGKTKLITRFNAKQKDGVLTIHLDKADGTILTTIRPTLTTGTTMFEFDLLATKGVHDLYFSYKNKNLKNEKDVGITFDWWAFTEDFPSKNSADYAKMKALYWKLLNANVKTTPVMYENPSDMQRKTNVFERGNWLVKAAEVQPKVPNIFPQLPKDAPQNRLGLAQWLTDKKNPLTARTMVNRLWEQLFGNGLVETLEDMGTQGFAPTHPELLDWLAYRFMHTHNWDMKKLLKDMVMSATYRQDSKTTPQYLALDPQNKLYARAPRVRLSAEQMRDQALSVSGALSEKMYGESVMPFQPFGLWQSPWNGDTWKMSEGEDQYRRAVYTYWKRSSPYPSMTTFDGVVREACAARRIRTNTPLQALVTMNDTAFVEASRLLALKVKNETPQYLASKNTISLSEFDVKACISKSYELAIGKSITTTKLESLSKLYERALYQFKKDKNKTCEMVGFEGKDNNPETAALMVVTNTIFNLDEFVVKN
jgi:Protein of unknown function (DUF1553)/Protein of unknown function (DUF1549)/Planctomycete cytochrome C